MTHGISLRLATRDDISVLETLIPVAVRGLSADFYTPEQVEAAIQHVFGPDSQLIDDHTYFVAHSGAVLVGCGGWSFRKTMYGGDQAKRGPDPVLDPATDAARIRAFFVHPEWARRGIGSSIMTACFAAAYAAGFRRLTLVATLPGEPLYHAFGFAAVERIEANLPSGVILPVVRMERALDALPSTVASRAALT